MAKVKIVYSCQSCGYQSPKWLGRCPDCGQWNSLIEEKQEHAALALCRLNSSLFYWFVTVFSDCRHGNKREVDAFPINLEALAGSASKKQLLKLARALMDDVQKNSENRTMRFQHDTLDGSVYLSKIQQAHPRRN